MNKQKLRFKVGDRVLARTGGGWEEAHITQLWSLEDRGLAPYKMRTVEEQEDIYTMQDSSVSVRPYASPGLPRIVLSILSGDEWEIVGPLIEELSIDVNIVGESLLLQAASAGNTEVVRGLIDDCNVPNSTCDKDGRNILHLALMNKQFDLVATISDHYQNLLLGVDNKGFNSVHFLIMAKDVDLLWDILYDQYFNQIEDGQLADLVDTHHQRYNKKDREKISSVISPLDWAKRMKQTEMADLLQQFINEQKVHWILTDIVLSSSSSKKVESDQATLHEFTQLLNNINEWGLDPKNMFVLNLNRYYARRAVGDAAASGYLHSVRFAIENFLFPLRETEPDIYRLHLGEFLHDAALGSKRLHFPNSFDNHYISTYPARWTGELNRLYYDWRGSDLIQFLNEKLAAQKASGESKYYGYDKWHEIVLSYLEKTLQKQAGVLVAERTEVLEYLLSLQTPSLTLTLPLHLMVQHGQLHLLQWAVQTKLVNLLSPVTTCPALVEHVHTLSWLTLERKNKKTGKRAIPGDMSIAEVLCALAVGLGECFTFRWLIQDVIPAARRSVTFNGKDLLRLAASQNSVLMVNAILTDAVLPAPQISESMVESFEQLNRVGAELLRFYRHSKPSSESLSAMVAIGLTSNDSTFRAWAKLESARVVCIELRGLIEQKAALVDLVACFTKFDTEVELWHRSYFYLDLDDNGTVMLPAHWSIADADDREALFACLAVLSIRADNLLFLEHIVSAMWTGVVAAEEELTYEVNNRKDFISMLSDFRTYATRIQKPLFTQWLANMIEIYKTHVLSRNSRRTDLGEAPFHDLARKLHAGAPVAELEECLRLQRVTATEMEMSQEEVREKYMSIEYLARNASNVYGEASSKGFIHIIKWLIEEQGLKVSYKHIENAIVNAIFSSHADIVQYLLESVFNPQCQETRMVPEGEEKDEEGEPRHTSFHARMAFKVAVFFDQAGIKYAFSENLLETTVVGPQLMQTLLDFALKHHLYSTKTPDLCFKILSEAAKHLHQRDHPDMWAFLDRLLSEQPFRDAINHKDMMHDIAENAFRLTLNHTTTTKDSLNTELYYTHSVRLINYLLDHGARSEPMVEFVVQKGTYVYQMEELRCLVEIVNCLMTYGANIQRVKYFKLSGSPDGADHSEVMAAFEKLESQKAEQRRSWALADAVAAGRSVEQLNLLLQEDGAVHVSAARNRAGHNLMQVAALHDRADVILWLHTVHGMDMSVKDKQGHSVLTLCRRAGAVNAARVVAEVVGGDKVRAFCWRHFHRRRILRAAKVAQKKRIAAVVLIQRQVRGVFMRVRYGPLLREVKGTWESFQSKWGAVLAAFKDTSLRKTTFSWAEQKFRFDMAVDAMESESSTAVQTLLDEAAAASRRDHHNTDPVQPLQLAFTQVQISGDSPALDTTGTETGEVDAVELSQAAVRWLDRADEAYRAMFQKKVARLAQGGRSYALSKRLKHCEFPISESKLDAGQRILWTYISRDSKQHVLVWFVSKHDNVSHCARLIDSACRRTFRSLNRSSSATKNSSGNSTTTDTDGSGLVLTEDSVLLDPSRNVPMKIYIAQRCELPLLAERAWKAPLRLNQREQGVRAQQGSVLLLGRSGTGKTLCVMDRMNQDRSTRLSGRGGAGGGSAGSDLRQLFVTRSSALCDFVRLYQQHHCAAEDLAHTSFSTFETFLQQLEAGSDGVSDSVAARSASKKVDFQRFRDNVFPLLTHSSRAPLDPLVVWTQIRSFLKGSVEAALEEGGVLSRAAYLDAATFSRDRCRLLPAQREEVYALFEQYQALYALHGWWDDMDRAMQLLRPRLSALQDGILSNSDDSAGPEAAVLCYDKVYVDEVQDNTQVEIALYLVAVRGDVDALFLAGDPAQSVVEGVEFRFEEVRSLVYQLSQRRSQSQPQVQSQSQEASLQRPTKLLVNYRSHSGILNCAGAVLGRMLAMFPGAAKTLPADEGLFLGPRPAFLNAASVGDVSRLLAGNERLVVLCPDERAGDVANQLQLCSGGTDANAEKPNLVLGIRAAKGLEFTDIVLLDFFGAIPDSDYKAWKELLAVGGGGTGGGRESLPQAQPMAELQQYAFPQLEPQLKLLYTAITRCINRLVFVESCRSRIGGLFFRWLKQHGLADTFSVQQQEEVQASTDKDTTVDAETGVASGLMTRDEWRMRGIDIALSAEGSGSRADLQRAAQLLGQAALCFQRAEEPVLRSVAAAQLALVQAESKHCGAISVGTSTRQLSSAEEVAVAGVVLRGVRVGLHAAARRLCHELEGQLSAQSRKFFTSDLLRAIAEEN